MATITFINKPVITTISPDSGFFGTNMYIYGEHLDRVTEVAFTDPFGRKTNAAFEIQGSTPSTAKILVTIPLIDGSAGAHMIKVTNAGGSDEHCCFTPWIPSGTTIPNISGDDVIQIDDKYAVNADIDSSSPNRTQGFEVLSLTYTPAQSAHRLIIQGELSLQSSFWGAGVLALFKDSEWTPRKVWSYSLMGLNMGQVAKISYVFQGGTSSIQQWKIRMGKATGTYPTIYLNRNVDTYIPWAGATSSWMSITEIEGQN